MPGRLVAISGGEGSGKSSVVAQLKLRYPSFVYTCEPGGTRVGAAIREILLNRAELSPQAATELLLFFADRAEHVATIISPAILRGATVVTDRYWMDTFAYQWWTAMNRTDAQPFLELVSRFDFPRPDLWIWLDVEPAVGLVRRLRAGDVNRIDRKDLAFHTRVREGFARLFELQAFPSVRIDTSIPLAMVVAEAEAAVARTVGSAVV